MTLSKLENNNAGFIASAFLCQELLEDIGCYHLRADDMNLADAKCYPWRGAPKAPGGTEGDPSG